MKRLLLLLPLAFSACGDKKGPDLSDFSSLAAVIKRHKTTANVNVSCANPESPNVFVYRNKWDDKSMALLTVTPKELDRILTAIEQP